MVPVDLTGPQQPLVDVLVGIDVVISCIAGRYLKDQIPLMEAAKKAGVGRFVPCHFASPAPRGVLDAADQVRALSKWSYKSQDIKISHSLLEIRDP